MHYIYEPHVHNDSEFPFIFHYDHFSENERVYPHWHEGIELLCFTAGKGTVCSNTDSALVVSGETAVINSGNFHTITMGKGGCWYYCLIVERGFVEKLGIDLDEAQFDLHVSDPGTAELFASIAREIEQEAPLFKQRVAVLAGELFIGLYRNHASVTSEGTSKKQHKKKMVKNIIDYIHSHYAEKLTVEQLAVKMGYSKFYLCHVFKEYTTMTVIEYINYVRCSHARRLLQLDGKTVSESMYLCGFNNLSYFSRTYQRYLGALPSQDIRSQ